MKRSKTVLSRISGGILKFFFSDIVVCKGQRNSNFARTINTVKVTVIFVVTNISPIR